jgi:hypothetical protein
MSNAPKRVTNVIISIGLRRLCVNLCVRYRSIEILRFGAASNWTPLRRDPRGTTMLGRICAEHDKNLPDKEKWLCSYCLVWRGLASMAQPSDRPPSLAAARGTDDLLATFHSTDEICRFDGFCPELIAH